MRITAPTASSTLLARYVFDGAASIARPLAGGHSLAAEGRERRALSDRRQLLLATPPQQERRTFDRRADDRTAARPEAAAAPVRKGLLLDVYA